MKRLSLVGIWLGLPSHSRKRLETPVEEIGLLDKGYLEMNTGPFNRGTHRLAELSDDNLFRFLYNEGRKNYHDKGKNPDNQHYSVFHFNHF
jgi:hypothetical protein